MNKSNNALQINASHSKTKSIIESARCNCSVPPIQYKKKIYGGYRGYKSGWFFFIYLQLIILVAPKRARIDLSSLYSLGKGEVIVSTTEVYTYQAQEKPWSLRQKSILTRYRRSRGLYDRSLYLPGTGETVVPTTEVYTYQVQEKSWSLRQKSILTRHRRNRGL